MKVAISLVILLSLQTFVLAQDFSNILNIFENAQITNQPTAQLRTNEQRCGSNSCRFHWIFALDESGSMQGIQWTKLKNLMNGIAGFLNVFIGNQRMTAYTFDSRATLPPA